MFAIVLTEGEGRGDSDFENFNDGYDVRLCYISSAQQHPVAIFQEDGQQHSGVEPFSTVGDAQIRC